MFCFYRSGIMSLSFASSFVRKNAPDQQATIQKLLDENAQLIAKIKECQAMGRVEDALPHQQLLHRNLVMLAKGADQSLLVHLKDDANGRPSPGAEGGGGDAASAGGTPGGAERASTPQQQQQQALLQGPVQQQQQPPQIQIGTPQPHSQQQPSPAVSQSQQMQPPASMAPPTMGPPQGVMSPQQQHQQPHPQQMQYMGHPHPQAAMHHQQYMQYQQGMVPGQMYGMPPGQAFDHHHQQQQQHMMYQQQQQQMAMQGGQPPQGYPQPHNRQ